MKRNPKPFSVEIKKSRVQGQRRSLPPRRLFDLPSAQPQRSVRRKCRKRWPSHWLHHAFCRASLSQCGATLRSLPLSVASVLRDRSRNPQPDVPPAEGAAPPIPEVQAQKPRSAQTKLRTATLKTVKPVAAPMSLSQPGTASEAPAIEAPSVNRSRQAEHRRLTKRQAAATQLPRQERWKRRLHFAAW
jgi:hypothetical protein